MLPRAAMVWVLVTGARLAFAAGLMVGPYLQAPRPDGVVVVWETDAASAGAVLVETAPDALVRVPSAQVGTHHEVSLTGFAPGSFHRYRVLVDDVPLGEPGSFVTLPAPGAPVTFAVVGDTRSDPAAHAACIAAVREHPVDVVVNTGDLVGSGEIEAEWTEFLRLEAPLIRDVPLLPVVGNHDEDGGELTPPYLRLFVPPASGLEHESYYSLRAGAAHLIVLDAQTEVLPEFVCTQQIMWWDACLNEAQRAWLEADLAAAAADPTVEHVVVFAHEGPYSSKEGRTGWAELRWLLPWFATSKVSAIFSGHDHLYEHGRALNGLAYVVSGGGGAPLYEPETEQSVEVHPREVLRNEVTHNFQIVEVDGPRLRVTSYECDGSLIEAFEVSAAASCAVDDDCAGGEAGFCPGAWSCDAGRCRWACPDEPECVAAPMCAHRDPGDCPGAWGCERGACVWTCAAEDVPAPVVEVMPDASSPEVSVGADAPRGPGDVPQAESAELAAEPTGGGSCRVATRGGAAPGAFGLLFAALALVLGRRARRSL